MGRRKRFEEIALSRFPAGTFARIKTALFKGERRMDFLRAAVESELASRETRAIEMTLARIPDPVPTSEASIVAKRCENCAWFDPDFVPVEHCVDPEDALGLCEWPADHLPWSLRYGNRERMAVAPSDGGQCAQWKERRPVTPEPETTQ